MSRVVYWADLEIFPCGHFHLFDCFRAVRFVFIFYPVPGTWSLFLCPLDSLHWTRRSFSEGKFFFAA